MNAQKEDELLQCHILERKRLPKILKADTKTRTMMYRESLRITAIGEFSLEAERERMKQVTVTTGDVCESVCSGPKVPIWKTWKTRGI